MLAQDVVRTQLIGLELGLILLGLGLIRLRSVQLRLSLGLGLMCAPSNKRKKTNKLGAIRRC